MPITYRIDQEHDVVWTTATGVLTDADLLAHKSRLINDADFKPGLRELSDVRAVDRLEVTPKSSTITNSRSSPRRTWCTAWPGCTRHSVTMKLNT
jgi:hypothetical protein